jgi:RimJ/RimL family protein N-acetyltransferase
MSARPELYDIVLRTPRLELRLGSHKELVELGRLAERGVHPPDEMPFSIAWTDRIGHDDFLDGFVEFHEQMLSGWSPADWTLNLLVWVDGLLVGTQGMSGLRFAEQRSVATGSWLGLEHQRHGIGTEMRAAVLELAFGALGAEVAASAWLEGNDASRRVSEKLGYRETGVRTERPRDIAVAAHEVELRRAEWSSPVAVRIDGLEPCLPLFGVSRSI